MSTPGGLNLLHLLRSVSMRGIPLLPREKSYRLTWRGEQPTVYCLHGDDLPFVPYGADTEIVKVTAERSVVPLSPTLQVVTFSWRWEGKLLAFQANLEPVEWL